MPTKTRQNRSEAGRDNHSAMQPAAHQEKSQTQVSDSEPMQLSPAQDALTKSPYMERTANLQAKLVQNSQIHQFADFLIDGLRLDDDAYKEAVKKNERFWRAFKSAHDVEATISQWKATLERRYIIAINDGITTKSQADWVKENLVWSIENGKAPEEP